jgi:hypothetical protein
MIKTIKYSIPSSRDEVSIKMMQRYMILIKGLPEPVQINATVKIHMMHIFCHLPIQMIRQHVSPSDLDHAVEQISRLIVKIHKEDPHFDPRTKIREVDFGMIPNLLKMSAGEYADASDYYQDFANWHKFAAVLFRPVTRVQFSKLLNIEQYEIQDYDGTNETAEIMRGFPAYKIIQAGFFLANSLLELQRISLDYSLEISSRMVSKMSQSERDNLRQKMSNSMPGGDGMSHFSLWPTEMLSKLMRPKK